MNNKDQIEDPIWRFARKTKPLKLFVQVFIVLSFLTGAWTITKPAFEFARNKFNYIFAIKPEGKLIKQDKYSFWSGFTLFETIHPYSNTDNSLETYFLSRQKLLKSFEVLNFDGKNTSSISDIRGNSFFERMTRNYELRDRLEGYLEKRSNGNLELYRSGFALAALIYQLQSHPVDRSKVQSQVEQFSLHWTRAQNILEYKLIEVELKHNDNEYFIYSQSDLMQESINTLEAIKLFYGPI